MKIFFNEQHLPKGNAKRKGGERHTLSIIKFESDSEIVLEISTIVLSSFLSHHTIVIPQKESLSIVDPLNESNVKNVRVGWAENQEEKQFNKKSFRLKWQRSC